MNSLLRWSTVRMIGWDGVEPLVCEFSEWYHHNIGDLIDNPAHFVYVVESLRMDGRARLGGMEYHTIELVEG